MLVFRSASSGMTIGPENSIGRSFTSPMYPPKTAYMENSSTLYCRVGFFGGGTIPGTCRRIGTCPTTYFSAAASIFFGF